MAINLSVIPYQIEVNNKVYLVHNRETDATYTYIGYIATGGEALIIRSKTDETETVYYKTNSTNYATNWADRVNLGYGII